MDFQKQLLEGEVLELSMIFKYTLKLWYDAETETFYAQYNKKIRKYKRYANLNNFIQKQHSEFNYSYHPVTVTHARKIFRSKGIVYAVYKGRHIKITKREQFKKYKSYLIK